MKQLWKTGLCLALGWIATQAQAQETLWRPAQTSLVRPAGGDVGTSTTVRPVSLSRPVPLDAVAQDQRPGGLVRAQVAEEKPLPPGPSLPGESSKPATSRSAPGPLPSGGAFTGPQPQATGTTVGPMPAQVPGPGDTGSIWGSTLPPGIVADGIGACGPDCCTTDCGSGCFSSCGCQDKCCGGLFWVNAEYLLWFTKGQSIPALVTMSPAGTPQSAAGVLGQPLTSTSLDRLNNDPRSGGRFSAGFWFPHACDWGADFTFFFLGTRSSTFTTSGAGDPEIARPLVDASTGREVSQLVAFPGLVTGSVQVYNYSKLWGLDTNLRHRICCGCNYWFDILGGYRHLELSEGISVTENLTVRNPDGTAANIIVSDRFQTVNRFDGGQIGVAGQYNFARRWFLGGSVKVAMGNVSETVNVGGSTTFSNFDFPGAINGGRNGGILALPTNIGIRHQNHFAVLPELGVKIGYDVTDHMRLYAGYDFFYLSSVVRPGEQIDTTINRTQIPNVTLPGTPALVGAARPAVLFRTSDYWAQGMSFGMQYHW